MRDRNILLIIIAVAFAIVLGSCSSQKSTTRDYKYEAYCDSIWNANPDYYMDVIMESDQYVEYVSINGEWWR